MCANKKKLFEAISARCSPPYDRYSASQGAGNSTTGNILACLNYTFGWSKGKREDLEMSGFEFRFKRKFFSFN